MAVSSTTSEPERMHSFNENKDQWSYSQYMYHVSRWPVAWRSQSIDSYCIGPVLKQYLAPAPHRLTHWGRVTHICVSKVTIIGSDNGLSLGRRQAIIWSNAGILLIRPLGTNFSEILIGVQAFSFRKMKLKMSSAKWCQFVSASMS